MFRMKKPFSHGQAFMLIVSIIIIAVGLSIPVSFVHTLKKIDPFCDYYCFEEWGEYMGQRRAYGTIVLVVQFIIPLIIIIICYTAISVRLGKSLLLKGKKRGYNWEMTMTDQQKAANKRRQRTNRMVSFLKFMHKTTFSVYTYGRCIQPELGLECNVQCFK